MVETGAGELVLVLELGATGRDESVAAVTDSIVVGAALVVFWNVVDTAAEELALTLELDSTGKETFAAVDKEEILVGVGAADEITEKLVTAIAIVGAADETFEEMPVADAEGIATEVVAAADGVIVEV